MATVELRPAYVWDCDECGNENFTTGIVVENSPEVLEQMKAERDIPIEFEGFFITMPDQVCCKSCWKKFTTRHFSQ